MKANPEYKLGVYCTTNDVKNSINNSTAGYAVQQKTPGAISGTFNDIYHCTPTICGLRACH